MTDAKSLGQKSPVSLPQRQKKILKHITYIQNAATVTLLGLWSVTKSIVVMHLSKLALLSLLNR